MHEGIGTIDDGTDDHIQEYEEVEIMERSATAYQRTATGRVLKGNDCEYIKLGSITANDGCTDGKDKDNTEHGTDSDNFREQVCDKAGVRSEEAVPHP